MSLYVGDRLVYRYGRNCADHQENQMYQYIWHMSLYVGDHLVSRYGWNSIHTCIPDSHLHRVTYARCRIDTIDSPADEHLVARNM